MDNSTIYLIIGIVAGILIWCWINYEIIYASSYGRKIWTESKKQTLLLASMAKQAGIEEDVINEILDEEQYKLKS